MRFSIIISPWSTSIGRLARQYRQKTVDVRFKAKGLGYALYSAFMPVNPLQVDLEEVTLVAGLFIGEEDFFVGTKR
jgi:hypothetical protein